MEPGEDFAALKKKYPNLKFVQTDVTDEPSVEKAIDQVVEEEGVINGMVANAGMTKHQPALDFSREQVEQLFKLNVSQGPQGPESYLG
jgi:NADP-dependent 3-hydroxy acid dehydrogenase YdfG